MGIAFGWLPKTTTTVTVTLTPPAGWFLVTPADNEVKESSGTTIWAPDEGNFDKSKHTWKGYGYNKTTPHDVVNSGTFALFIGNLYREGGTGGSKPDFGVSVADVDIDVQCKWPHVGPPHWQPDNSDLEDRVEADEPNGGSIIPILIEGEFPSPSDFATKEPYKTAWKAMGLRLNVPWDDALGGTGNKGYLRFDIYQPGLAIYYYDNRDHQTHRVTTGQEIPINSDDDITPTVGILTNEEFTAPVAISAVFMWYKPPGKGDRVWARDYVRVVPQVLTGELKLNMRRDGDHWYEYPCIWTEQNKANLIQYKTTSSADGIKEVIVRVTTGTSNVQWKSSGLATAADWTDSNFKTRTNQQESTDANGKPNYDGTRYKFLDPGTTGNKPYSAQLLIVPVGSDVPVKVDEETFHARTRKVFYTRTADTPFEAFGKTYMWKLYGKAEANATPVCTDPSNDDPNLFFGPDGKTFNTAYDCVTPRGAFRAVAHGLIDGSQIRLDQTWYKGFGGPSSAQGTQGGAAPVYDLTGHAEMHDPYRMLFTCFSTKTFTGYTCSVATSMKNGLEHTVGGGYSVVGFPGVCLLWPGKLTWTFQGTLGPELTANERSRMMALTNEEIQKELVRLGVFNWYDNETQQETADPDEDDRITFDPQWIHDHTFATIDDIVGCNLATISQNAKNAFMAEHPGHPDFTWILTSLAFSYDIADAKYIGTTASVAIPGVE
ncbi:MAG: hypothetical protein JW809_15035 [Pirellulales bacterium]|nr:hypothetical protein [Pirellulales bacterium]